VTDLNHFIKPPPLLFSNNKIGPAWSWSRAVGHHAAGGTCGPCPLLDNGCYVQGQSYRHKAMQAGGVRRTHHTPPIDAMTASMRSKSRWLRLLVSGDHAKPNTARLTPDDSYIASVVDQFTAAAARAATDPSWDIRGWSYTHLWRAQHLRDALLPIRDLPNFTLLASCDNERQLSGAIRAGWLPTLWSPRIRRDSAYYMVGKLRGFVCPAERFENVDCTMCRACMDRKPPRIDFIAFPDHGPGNAARRAAVSHD
jgi:hypothetical protein